MNMSLEMFIRKVMEEITKRYPEYIVEISTNTALNGAKLVGLNITKKGDQFIPFLLLDKSFEAFLQGESLQNIAADIISCYHTNDAQMSADKQELEEMRKFDSIKNKICYRVIETARNSDVLDKMVSIQYLNLSIVFYVSIGKYGAVIIKKEMLQDWNITERVVLERAVLNTPALNPIFFAEMREVFRSKVTGEKINDIDLTKIENNYIKYRDDMYVLSNRERLCGAAVIFYPNVLDQLYRFFDNQDFYILPSSIHEVMIVPADAGKSMILRKMIREINKEHVREEEILSDELYLYSGERKKIGIFK